MIIAIIFLSLLAVSYMCGCRRARYLVSGDPSTRLHSRLDYYGYFVMLWCGVPSLILLLLLTIGRPVLLNSFIVHSLNQSVKQSTEAERAEFMLRVENVAAGVIAASEAPEAVRAVAAKYGFLDSISYIISMVLFLSASICGLLFGYKRVQVQLPARAHVESIVKGFLFISSTIAIVTTIGIFLSLVLNTFVFFESVSFFDFVFGLKWNSQIAIRADQAANAGSFGSVPLFVGTALIACIAMGVSVPLGLLSSIYIAEYAQRRVRSIVKPLLEILAGIPTIVYGFFAALIVAPFISDLGALFGVGASTESALAAGVVMGLMIVPFMTSLSDDVIHAIPQSLRDGSYALGATKSETIKKVIIPAALPGIFGAFLISLSRAIGETMIVVMAAGLFANLTINPFESVTTVTVQIVSNQTGDNSFDDPRTLSSFALGLALFFVTLTLNYIALVVVKKYREKYE